MNKVRVNYFIDLLLAVDFIIVLISGFERDYKLHRYSSYVLIFLVALHLILHFEWIKDETKSFFVKEEKPEKTKIIKIKSKSSN